MATLLREIAEFLKAVFIRWWGLMSCAVWTLLSIYGLTHSEPNAWYIAWSFRLIFVFLPICMFLAWREQNQLLQAQIARIKGYENKTSELIVVSQAAWDGNYLAADAPDKDAAAQKIADWQSKVDKWTKETHELLRSISPIAANKFFQARNSKAQIHLGIARELMGDLSLLNEKLDNLTDIMEKSNIYLANVRG
jgi:hypothetical protein